MDALDGFYGRIQRLIELGTIEFAPRKGREKFIKRLSTVLKNPLWAADEVGDLAAALASILFMSYDNRGGSLDLDGEPRIATVSDFLK